MQYIRPEFANLVLGESSEELQIENSEQNQEAALSMVRQTRRTLDIVSRDLDPAVYDDADFTQAVKNFVLNNRQARVRILVQDLGPVVKRGHQLVELFFRLTTFIDIREPSRDHADYNAAVMVVDRRGVILRSLGDRYEGSVNFNAPRQAGELLRLFNDMWAVAKPDPNLRRLHM